MASIELRLKVYNSIEFKLRQKSPSLPRARRKHPLKTDNIVQIVVRCSRFFSKNWTNLRKSESCSSITTVLRSHNAKQRHIFLNLQHLSVTKCPISRCERPCKQANFADRPFHEKSLNVSSDDSIVCLKTKIDYKNMIKIEDTVISNSGSKS